MLLMKYRILLSKLTYIGKLMAKSSPTNMCRRALNNDKLTCNEKDLLAECQTWSKKLRITDVTKGCLDRKSIKTAIWKKNEET